MTLLHCDSFESYSPTDLNKTIKRHYGFEGVIETSIVKTGSQCIRHWYSDYCAKYFPPFTNNRVYVGFHFRTTNTATHELLRFISPSGLECSLQLLTGKFAFYRFNNNLLATGTQTIQNNTWYFVEVKATVANSTSFGDVIVRLNEVTDIEMGAGMDTAAYGDSLTTIQFYNNTTGAYNYIDNFYVCDDQGSFNNTFLGECVVECIRPNADGNSSQFDGSDGNQINNYLLVDDVYPEDTAEYVEGQNLNEKDLYGMSNLSIGAASIKGVRLVTAMYRATYGKRFMKHVVRTNGTDYEGNELIIGEGDFMYGEHIWQVNPDTGVLWTEGQIGSLECGFKISE